MARIRSIKPEFVTDGDMQRLSDSCALFFILLWNHCDDEGKHPLDLSQLVAELGGRWHRGKVKLFVSCLVKSGQLRINSTSTWLQVTGWSHQKIDKPKQPKIKSSEFQWLNTEDSTIALDHSRDFGARIGSDRIDRIGSDLSSRGVQAPSLEAEELQAEHMPVQAKAKPQTTETWEAYSAAYQKRYSEPPVRNATVNGQLSQLVKRLGAEESPLVAAFYVTHNDRFYIQCGHAIGILLKNAEKIRTEWKTNRPITSTQAALADKASHFQSQMDRIRRGEL